MIFGYFILAVALVISAVSAFYSITGLTAIFAAAFWPIIIMGSALEVGKIATTVWLHKYWRQAAMRYKLYLVPAVAVLMLITSMGIFGFLSKAHLDQAVPSGDVAAKVSLYDEKIQIQRENIKAARANLSQLDAAVNETMGRSTSEQGADKAVAIRRAQAKDRAKLMQEIDQAQKVITQLQEERAPIAAEQRKVEAEVGPIKYIAALIYDQEAATNADLLERAVRWVIILIVSVFDPLALVLILAATQTIEWERSDKTAESMDKVGQPTKPSWKDKLQNLKSKFAAKPKEEKSHIEDTNILSDGPPLLDVDASEEARAAEANALLADIEKEPETEVFVEEQPKPKKAKKPKKVKKAAPVERQGFFFRAPTDVIGPGLVEPEELKLDVDALKKLVENQPDIGERPGDHLINPAPVAPPAPARVPEAAPGLNRGVMTSLTATPDNAAPLPAPTHNDFGSEYPSNPMKGDLFLRVDILPNKLFKYNGNKWIEVDKDQTDVYAYNEEYIKYLITQIENGQYDTEYLTDSERQQIQEYLAKN